MMVFGLGGDEAEKAQKELKTRELRMTEKSKKVNRAAAAAGGALESNPDLWMMDLVGRTGASTAFRDDKEKAKEHIEIYDN